MCFQADLLRESRLSNGRDPEPEELRVGDGGDHRGGDDSGRGLPPGRSQDARPSRRAQPGMFNSLVINLTFYRMELGAMSLGWVELYLRCSTVLSNVRVRYVLVYHHQNCPQKLP